VNDEIKDDEWTFRDLSLGFHLRNDDILRYDPEVLLKTGREWNIVAALNILGRSGNFTQLNRLPPVMAATSDSQIWDAGINMLGFSGSWSQIVRWYDLFMQRPDAPGVKYYMAFLLGASCDRRAVKVLLNLYSRSSDSEEVRNHVIRELSCLLEDRNNGIFLARNADPPVEDLASLIRPSVEAQASKESNSIFEGAVLDVPNLAEKMRNELFQENVARGRLLRGRLVLEAATGIDCAPMFNEMGNLNRLAAIAILDEFLDTDPGARFLPGRRYFFGHPIPL